MLIKQYSNNESNKIIYGRSKIIDFILMNNVGILLHW